MLEQASPKIVAGADAVDSDAVGRNACSILTFACIGFLDFGKIDSIFYRRIRPGWFCRSILHRQCFCK